MALLRTAVRKPDNPHPVRACLLVGSFDFEETGAPNYHTDLDLVDASVDCIRLRNPELKTKGDTQSRCEALRLRRKSEADLAALEDALAWAGIMNAAAYAKKFAEDEWTWEALVRCSDEMLDVLVQRVGMKEGSALMLKSGVRGVRNERAQIVLLDRLLPVMLAVGLAVGFVFPWLVFG